MDYDLWEHRSVSEGVRHEVSTTRSETDSKGIPTRFVRFGWFTRGVQRLVGIIASRLSYLGSRRESNLRSSPPGPYLTCLLALLGSVGTLPSFAGGTRPNATRDSRWAIGT